MSELAITIVLPPGLRPADAYRAVHDELGVWPTVSSATRDGTPDLVVYVWMTLSVFGGAVAEEVATQTVAMLKRAFARLVRRGPDEPDREMRLTDETTGVVFVLDSGDARSEEALSSMVRPVGWIHDPGTELRWDAATEVWRSGRVS